MPCAQSQIQKEALAAGAEAIDQGGVILIWIHGRSLRSDTPFAVGRSTLAKREVVVLNSNDADKGSACASGLVILPLWDVAAGLVLEKVFLFCLLILSYYKLFKKRGVVKADLAKSFM